MQYAIAIAVAVDEVKDIRDKAMALEKYAQQANNYDAERRCAQLRISAETKCGMLLKQTEKAKGGGDTRKPKEHRINGSRGAKTLAELGVSQDQSRRWRKLAENPRAVAHYLRDEEGVPTTTAAIEAAAPAKPKPKASLPFSDEALWLTARLRDLVKADINPARIAKGCDEDLKVDNRRSIDILLPLFKKLRELL